MKTYGSSQRFACLRCDDVGSVDDDVCVEDLDDRESVLCKGWVFGVVLMGRKGGVGGGGRCLSRLREMVRRAWLLIHPKYASSVCE